LSLYPHSLFFWQSQTGSGFTDATIHQCTPGQAGCTLLKGDRIDNAIRVGLSAWVMVFGEGGSLPRVQHFHSTFINKGRI
jgi:hypothetical protein